MLAGGLNQGKMNRFMSLLLTAVLTIPPLASCGNGSRGASAPPIDDTRGGQTTTVAPNANANAQKKPGLSNGQKALVTLAGAAALYYLYNQHKNAQAKAGPNSQYYLSKNGRVYYRDEQHRAHWVTPPSNGIQVPAEQADRYREFEGYNNRPNGRDLSSLPEAQSATY